LSSINFFVSDQKTFHLPKGSYAKTMPCSGGHLAFSDRHKKHKFCKGPCKEHLTKFAIRSFGGFR
jgi:hypothetical protein